MTGLRLVRQPCSSVDVGVNAEVADMGEPGVVEGVRANEDAEAPAAQEAEPVTELDAEALQLELADDCGVGLGVACAHSRAQALELGGLLSELLHRLGERECLADLVLDRL